MVFLDLKNQKEILVVFGSYYLKMRFFGFKKLKEMFFADFENN